MAARWVKDNLEDLRSADPPIPVGLGDRAADNWTPLLAIVDLERHSFRLNRRGIPESGDF
jgi:hypothetical protein